MKFSYEWLNSFFKEDLPPPQQLGDKLMMKFFEVEDIQEENDDSVLDIEVLPNRAHDCFSHIGLAREIAAIYDLDFTYPDEEVKATGEMANFPKLEVQDKELCPRYILGAIKISKLPETPEFIQKRLKTCGLQTNNLIVDITNYVMLETGQPLHGFDGRKIEGNTIQVRRAQQNESITTLEGEEYKLDRSVLVIADESKPIGIAGLKGGKAAEITKETELIYLEAANFDPKTIRRASKNLKFRTEASSRFEAGLDPNLAEKAFQRALYLIKKYAEGEVIEIKEDFYPDPVQSRSIELEISKVQSVLGIDLDQNRMVEILEDLGFQVEEKKDVLEVEIPTRRKDITLEEDLIEEIGRIYGYDNISSQSPKASVIPPERNYQLFWEDKTRNILEAAGFAESYNYTFINEEDRDIFGFRDLIEMENPVSENHKFLRPSLMVNLLKNAKENEDVFKQIAIFEVGKIFEKPSQEKKMLGGIKTNIDFREIKGDVELLLEKLGIGKVWYDSFEADPESSLRSNWDRVKAAEIKVRQETLGFIGRVSSDILAEMKINDEVYTFEMNMGKLAEMASDKKQYQNISKFPTAVKDIAVLIPRKVKYEEVYNQIETLGGKLLVDVDLFDIYEGDSLPEGKRNLGFRLFFQAKDRTLSKEEINSLLEEIITGLEEESDWQVRKQ